MSRRFQFSLLVVKTLLAIATGAIVAFLGTAVFFGSKPLMLGFVVAVESWLIVVYAGTVITKRQSR
jgi:hypothetical protein